MGELSAFPTVRRWHHYVPWTMLALCIVIILGLGMWASSSHGALEQSDLFLSYLGLSMHARFIHYSKVAVITIAVFYAVLCGAVFTVTVFRLVMKIRDERGGTPSYQYTIWLIVDGTLIGLWWTMILIMTFAIMGQVTWMSATYAVDKAVEVGAALAQTVTSLLNETMDIIEYYRDDGGNNSSQDDNSTFEGDNSTPPAVLSLQPASKFTPPGSSNSSGTSACSYSCIDLSALQFILGPSPDGGPTCMCHLDRVVAASIYTEAAMSHMHTSMAGVFLLYIASTWVLMYLSADFGAIRRERKVVSQMEARVEGQRLLDNPTFEPSSGPDPSKPYSSKRPHKHGGSLREVQQRYNKDGGEDDFVDEGLEMCHFPPLDEEGGLLGGSTSPDPSVASFHSARTPGQKKHKAPNFVDEMGLKEVKGSSKSFSRSMTKGISSAWSKVKPSGGSGSSSKNQELT